MNTLLNLLFSPEYVALILIIAALVKGEIRPEW
jgi:hypothetical protein